MNAKTSFKLTPIPNSESVRHNGEFAGVVRRDLRYIAHAFMLVKWARAQVMADFQWKGMRFDTGRY